MNVKFTKMHGLGNDFVMINLVSQLLDIHSVEQLFSHQDIAMLSNRQTGVGFDQLLVVEPPESPEVDFRYRIFNADGGEVEHCGNGARCFAIFVREQGLTSKKTITVETKSGISTLEVLDDDRVRVNMGAPVTTPGNIPFDPGAEGTSGTGPLFTLATASGEISLVPVSMGNPHGVIQVEDVSSADVEGIGHLVQEHAAFPNSVNVGFMQVISRNCISLRVYERGTGETLACGTGACAAVVAGQQLELLDHDVTVRLPGGELEISWNPGENNGHLLMTGPVETVYHGQLEIPENKPAK